LEIFLHEIRKREGKASPKALKPAQMLPLGRYPRANMACIPIQGESFQCVAQQDFPTNTTSGVRYSPMSETLFLAFYSGD